MNRLNADSIQLCRDRHGRVEEVILLNHGQLNRVTRAISVEQLELRVATLRNVALKYDGIPVKAEGGFEVWAIGDRGARFTITIPSVEALIRAGNSTLAASFMDALTASEEKLGSWLTRQLENTMRSSREVSRPDLSHAAAGLA